MSLINRKHGVLSYVIINLCGSVSILLDMLKCSTPNGNSLLCSMGYESGLLANANLLSVVGVATYVITNQFNPDNDLMYS